MSAAQAMLLDFDKVGHASNGCCHRASGVEGNSPDQLTGN
jgi:hypothetical protein